MMRAPLRASTSWYSVVAVLAAVLVTAVAIFLLNILIDLAYAMLDPRIRHE